MNEEQWRPTKEFFERDIRATKIRNLCLMAIDASQAAISGLDEDYSIIGRLLDVNAELHIEGVEPGMHTIERSDPNEDEKRALLQSDPVTLAEWIAGQVCEALIEAGVVVPLSAGELEEHTESLEGSNGGVRTFTPLSISSNTRRFMNGITMLGALKSFTDYASGPSDL